MVAWAVAGAGPAGAVDYRFRSPTPTVEAAVPLNARVLTDAERQFIAGLPELRVGVPTPPAQPYEMVGADGQVSGIHPEMLVALARTFGLRLTPVVLPDWSSVLQAARERRVDIVMTLGVTTERLDYLAFTIGATPLPGALFARRGAEIDPAHTRFALERNYLAVDHVRRQYPEASILTVETTADALRAVADGRADAYLGSLLEASDWLAREPQPGLEIHRLVSFGTGYYHFGVRKDWAPLATILNKGIQSLRSSTTRDLAAALGASLPSGTVLSQPLLLPDTEAALLAHHPVWRVGAVQGLTMLNDIDANGLHTGIGAEYAEQVARRLGVATQPVAFGSVAAMLDALRRREIDLVPFLTRTPEREKDFAYSAPYVEMPYMLVARSDGPLYWNLDSLRGRRLALAPQHPLRGLLARDYPDIRIVDAASGNDAMDRVARREADAAVEVKLFANLRINADNDGSLRTVAEVYELPAQFHLATARGGPPLMPLVERALADIPPDERLRMLRRWVAVDLRPGFPWRRHLPLLVLATAALLALAGGTGWWMRRLSREVRARRRSEALLNDIATTVPGVAFRYIVGADGTLRHNYFTPGAKAFLGVDLDPRQTVPGSLGPRLRPEHRAAAVAEQEACARTGRRFKATGAYRHPDGRERWLHTEAVRSMLPDGRAVWTGYVVDVSTERELQQRLEREAEARHLMLASASHELRAPTHTLSLALQALGTAGLEGDQQQALRIARESAHTLTQLLDDVLDSARLDQQALGLHPRTVDLRALLAEVADAWRPVARDKGLAFALEIAPEVPALAELDPLRVKQVLTNLLSNACKYTAEGRVGLGVDVVQAADGPRLRMVVDDTGVGIDAQQQPRLFEPFATVDDPTQPPPALSSSGLGLSICRRLASMMGGSIGLDSARGRGTRLCFELPLRQPPTLGAAAAQRPQGHLVVVCDDDATSRLLLAHMLRQQGLEVAETGQGDEALALWRRGGVRAIVTDLDMPGMDGPSLLRQVRAEEAAQAGRLGRTALIVCSGSLAEFGGDASAVPLHDAMLLKPVDVSALVEALRRLGVTAAGPASA